MPRWSRQRASGDTPRVNGERQECHTERNRKSRGSEDGEGGNGTQGRGTPEDRANQDELCDASRRMDGPGNECAEHGDDFQHDQRRSFASDAGHQQIRGNQQRQTQQDRGCGSYRAPSHDFRPLRVYRADLTCETRINGTSRRLSD
jgi:hypothetical protein